MRRGDGYALACRHRLEEAAPLQAPRVERQAEPVVPEALQQVTATSAKHEEIASKGRLPPPR